MSQELNFWLAKIPTLPHNPQQDDLVVFLDAFNELFLKMVEAGVDSNTYSEILNIQLEMEANAFPRKFAC
jgi:hypothetical protein